jgi:hypothetical protein
METRVQLCEARGAICPKYIRSGKKVSGGLKHTRWGQTRPLHLPGVVPVILSPSAVGSAVRRHSGHHHHPQHQEWGLSSSSSTRVSNIINRIVFNIALGF